MKSYIVHMAKHANIAAMNVDTLTFNMAKFFRLGAPVSWCECKFTISKQSPSIINIFVSIRWETYALKHAA